MSRLTEQERHDERVIRVRRLTNERLAALAEMECVVPLDYEMSGLARDEMKRREAER